MAAGFKHFPYCLSLLLHIRHYIQYYYLIRGCLTQTMYVFHCSLDLRHKIIPIDTRRNMYNTKQEDLSEWNHSHVTSKQSK